MKRSEKAERIAIMLEEFYPETPVPLDHENPFQLLVAVLMSAQTTDLKVNEVTPALFAKAPNAKEMAELLMERHGGEVPASFEELEDYPALVTKLLVLLWPSHLASQHFPSIPTFIA